MRTEGHEGSLGERFMQQSGSHAQGHRNKNIFCKVASEEWELGMRVAWLGRWVSVWTRLSCFPTGQQAWFYPRLLANTLSFFES